MFQQGRSLKYVKCIRISHSFEMCTEEGPVFLCSRSKCQSPCWWTSESLGSVVMDSRQSTKESDPMPRAIRQYGYFHQCTCFGQQKWAYSFSALSQPSCRLQFQHLALPLFVSVFLLFISLLPKDCATLNYNSLACGCSVLNIDSLSEAHSLVIVITWGSSLLHWLPEGSFLPKPETALQAGEGQKFVPWTSLFSPWSPSLVFGDEVVMSSLPTSKP